MKPIIWAAILLILLDGFALAYQGLNDSHHGQGMDGGSMPSMNGAQGRIPFTPILGGLALVGGIVLLAVGAKKT